MSTGTSIEWTDANAIAKEFRNLFDHDLHFDNWITAGSLRRHKKTVGDIEHVVVARMDGDHNQLWDRLDAITKPDGGYLFGSADGDWPCTRATYSNGTQRWGDKYRGVMFGGIKHEIFTATPRNWGAILAIRTGPAEYSQMLVTKLLERGLRQQDGHVIYNRGASAGQIIDVPTEEKFFELCGVKWCEPESRQIGGAE